MNRLIYNEDLLGTAPDTVLAKRTGKSCGYIWRERTKRGMPTFNSVYGHQPLRGYRVDVFDEINIVSAYWLGFYFADGCVYGGKKGNRNLVNFSVSDYDVLEKLALFYEIDVKYIGVKNTPEGEKHFFLDLSNRHLFQQLVSLGCVPNKSHIVEPPKINDQFYIPFLMGFYDGDGCLSRNSSINSWKVGIGTAGKTLFEWIIQLLVSMGLIFSHEKRPGKNGDFYEVVMCGITAKVFLDILYNSVPEGLPLTRKKVLYEELSSVKFRRGPDFTDWEINIIKNEKNNAKCATLIELDHRNYGWKRSADTIRHKRKLLS